ncbi:MAG: hypothetical protein LBQ70_01695 [Prevotellaceae bacterium]|nr:hypothetical protein [Prevotellaceae bacterium]
MKTQRVFGGINQAQRRPLFGAVFRSPFTGSRSSSFGNGESFAPEKIPVEAASGRRRIARFLTFCEKKPVEFS